MQNSAYYVNVSPAGVTIENPRVVCYSNIVKQKNFYSNIDEGDPYETGIFIGKN